MLNVPATDALQPSVKRQNTNKKMTTQPEWNDALVLTEWYFISQSG